MKYQLEHISDLTEPQKQLKELFEFIATHEDQATKFAADMSGFFRLWAGREPLAQLKLFTSRAENGELKGVVLALVIQHPLFIKRPAIHRFVDLTLGDTAFEQYINVICESW